LSFDGSLKRGGNVWQRRRRKYCDLLRLEVGPRISVGVTSEHSWRFEIEDTPLDLETRTDDIKSNLVADCLLDLLLGGLGFFIISSCCIHSLSYGEGRIRIMMRLILDSPRPFEDYQHFE
jgi:hypothetical protein